ncbi:MAG: cobyrinic acid a,c-diamide synthase, partial [Emergencia timonensis]
MKSKINRVLLAGTGSGCGKTTVVCGLLKALADRGQKAASFKCGPDYID